MEKTFPRSLYKEDVEIEDKERHQDKAQVKEATQCNNLILIK